MNGGPELQEISGLDQQGIEEVGAAFQRVARRTGMHPKIRPGFGMGHGADVLQQMAPLPITSILTTVTQDITILPQRDFKLTRLLLVDTTDFEKSLCTVDNLKVGAENQFINNGSAPFQAFLYNAVGCGLTGNIAVSGRQLILTVTNRSTGTRIIYGMFFGPAADSKI